MKLSLPLFAVILLASLISACSTSDVASSDRECRTQGTAGSKMRQSVCHSKERWAAIDASTAEQQQNTDLKDEIFRRSLEQAAQNAGPAFDTP